RAMTTRPAEARPAAAGGRIGLVLIVLGLLAAMALLSLHDEPVALAVEPVRVEPPLAQFAPEAPRGAVPLLTSGRQPPAAMVPNPSPAPVPPRLPVPIAFSILGTTTEGGETSLLLYGGGRTLTVRGPGPIGEDYVVDAIQDGHVVLRFVPTGTNQVLELKS